MNNLKYLILGLCISSVLICAFTGIASAKTWYVDDDGPANFSSIQDAVDAASDGDVIIVKSGTYYENVNVNKLLILKGVNTGTGKPIVDADGSGSPITLSAYGVTLEGFTATNTGKYDAGIKVTSNNDTIIGNDASNNYNGIHLSSSSNNIITGNNASNNDDEGIYLYNSSNNTIIGNNVSNNDYGIYLRDSCSNTITGNNARNNKQGIHLSSSSNNVITGNNASNNDDEGIYLYNSSSNTIIGNNVSNSVNRYGILLHYSRNINITGNNISNNKLGIYLSYSSNNPITGNNISNNRKGIYYYSSRNNDITGNTFVNDGLFVGGDSYQNTVEDNIVNGKPLVYLEDTSDFEVTDAGQVILVNCNNITVDNLDLSNTCVGIDLRQTEDSIISNNTVSNNNNDGISLVSSGNNTITSNTVSNNSDDGIHLYNSSSNTITGNNAMNNDNNGIYLGLSSRNTITGNNVSNNWNGIYLSDSCNIILSGNTFVNDGLFVDGDSYQNTVKGNTVNAKPLIYLEDASDIVVTDAGQVIGQVILVNCNNITVDNLDLSNTAVGIELLKTEDSKILNNSVCNNRNGICLRGSSSNNTITGNTASNNNHGIWLWNSSNNTITGNTASVNNRSGIYLSFSSNNTIKGNIASNNKYYGIYFTSSSNNTIKGNTASVNNRSGIYLSSSSNNTIKGNTASNNSHGIYLEYSRDINTITNNTVGNNSHGIYLSYSSNNNITGNKVSNNRYGISLHYSCTPTRNNKIYLNNFIDNTDNVYSYNSDVIWNTTEEITYTYRGSTHINYLGNYWSDHKEKYPNAKEIDACGIWDTPYSIDGYLYKKDNYPLIVPFENYFTSPPNGPFNIIRNQTTQVQIVLRGQDLDFNSSVGWPGKRVMIFRVVEGDIVTVYSPDSNNRWYYVNWSTTGDYYVNYENSTIYDAQLSVMEPIMNLDLKVNGNSISSIIQGNPLRIDFVSNLDANDMVDLKVMNPDDLILKTNPADPTQKFDDIKVSKLMEYGSMNESKQINTTGWDIGTYTFSVRTEAENAQGLDMCSATKTLTVSQAENIFDTGAPTNPYPSIFGTHNGTIKPNQIINVSTLYTYPCPGTGGHTEYARIWNTSLDVNATWNGYVSDWHNISFTEPLMLVENETYNYTIRTGSYPQIIHKQNHTTLDGSLITCEEFIDVNGRKYNGWIPAIRLEGENKL